MTKAANTSSVVTTLPPVMMNNPGEHDDFLNDLLSGIDDQTVNTVAALTALEETQLELIDGMGLTEVKVIEAAPAAVEEPVKKPRTRTKKAEAAPAPAAPVIEEPAQIVVEEAAPAAPEPAKAPAPRQVFALKSEKIAHKLGEKKTEFLILDVKDNDLEAGALKIKQAAILDSVDSMAVKVGEKATMLFGYLRNGGKLNEVMRRTFTVLLRDGFLSTGDKGNLITELEKKPYSMGTCRSQATQMFQLFPALSICHEKSGGKLALNTDSTIVRKMKAELGL